MTDTVFLNLGQRPDEPGPPVGGPTAYPPEVAARLTEDAARIVARYPQARSALLPLLHLVQAEDGCLTSAGIAFCANRLELTDAEVTAVATFYSMYRRTPTGDYLVGVCTNTLCAIMGGDEILDALQDHLGVPAGQTTDPAEGLAAITLEHIECNAACDYAPVVMVNWEFFDNQTPASARDLVDSLRAGAPVTPTRGAPLCTFRDTARTLAGLADPRAVTNSGGTGDATLAGLRVARANGMSAPDPAQTEDQGTQPDPEITEAADSTRDEPAPAPTESVPGTPVDGSAP
ncbi:NADH-quinone oxidoreductase subunit NuoE [Mycolicibacterium sp. S2-37]|uniref:NADH-quinone oxidoreductase subunit NuoE n=1 Tax=Mycolicibacterium sp. S2-37 TaxID=2810297 RepID=UPI001A942799|nr:NADH-quinone oxidoreductase subunit NuoE [Mycolicibacterium sp. S2-37]MBO0677534.1 NADH-quinone oxidoreductase subunit NuoE [Mycolicibacterium sp. S2-37]